MIQVIKKIFAFSGTRRKLLEKSILVSFIGAIFAALQIMALMLTITAVISGNKDMKTAWLALGIMAVSVAGQGICSYFSNNANTETGYFMVAEKRIHIGDRLRYIPMGYFNKNSLGNITAVVTTTLTDVEGAAARCLVLLLSGFLNTAVLSLMLFFADWRLALIAIAGILVYLVFSELSQRAAANSTPARQSAQENLVESVLEYIQGMGVVKAFGLEKDNNQSIQKSINASCDKNLKVTYSTMPWAAMRQLVVKLFGIVIAVCAVLFCIDGTLTVAMCMIMLVVSFMVYKELESAGNVTDLLQMLGTTMDKADSVDNTPVMDGEGQDISAKDSSIVFDKVDFSYGSRKILDQVSLRIPEKTTTAVVGPSGGGKTTMCNLIARFWDVDSGTISVGGRNIKDYKLDSLMKNISMVFQDVYLFQDTIENNIKFGRQNATHEEVVEAAKAACCHEFIMALPDGYDTVAGEGGSTLSGGEKQRISIARAMLKDAPIVILDEATASVDPENEAELQKAIEALTHDKTIIMIAHRLKTVRNADQILVLAGGHIVQQGTHEELVKQKGIYADFIGERKEAIGWKLA